jgi:hypothetical protein
MSSSIDFFTCPQCGGNASKEQDNNTCEIHISCKCGWSGGEITKISEIIVRQRIIETINEDLYKDEKEALKFYHQD